MNEENMDIPLIDVRKVFHDKNPKLAKWIPGFLFRYFERLICQEKMNNLLLQTRGLKGVEFIRACFREIGVKIHVRNKAHVPEKGRVILAANHPLGGLDGMGFISEVHKIRPDVKFLVNDILMNVKPLQELFLGVNKHGSNAKRSLVTVDQQFASEGATLIFPAGLVSRKQQGKIMDLKWHKSYITKSVRYRSDIIPVYIEGRNSRRFYNVAKFRKMLGFKLNIEMLLLPSEMFRQKDKVITIYFGKPIPASVIRNIGEHYKIAEAMRHFVYTIRDNPEADFEDFYNAFRQK